MTDRLAVGAAGPGAAVRLADRARVRRFRGAMLAAVGPHTYELTEVAAFILTCVDGRRSVLQIGAVVASEYDVDVELAVEDAAALVSELAGLGVLVVEDLSVADARSAGRA